ncbi:Pentatricopeptide repeat-containing protein At2g25580 [Linum grandiflorum]
MLKRRVCLVAVKSLGTSPRLHFPGESSCPIKPFFFRNLSTAQSLERRDGESQTPVWQWNSSNAAIGLTSNIGFRESRGNQWSNQDRQNDRLGGVSGSGYSENNGGGYHKENRSSVRQKSGIEKNGYFDGKSGYRNDQFQQNVQGNVPNLLGSWGHSQQNVHVGNMQNPGGNLDGVYRRNDSLQRTGEAYMERPKTTVQSSSGYCSQGSSPSHNGQHGRYGMDDRYQHNRNVGQYQQGVVEIQGGTVASPQQSIQGGTVGSAQQSDNNDRVGAVDGDPMGEMDRFCDEGKAKEAVEMLQKLQGMQVTVDWNRVLRLIHVCGDCMALAEAKLVHEHIMRSKAIPSLDIDTYHIILEMYSKCGAMDVAFDVFNKMPERNWISFDTMITWLAKNDYGYDAIDLFSQFKQAGFTPNAKMFLGVFSACAAAGDIDEGMLHFASMTKDYSIVPTIEHYTGIVQMLGSNGYLDEAFEYIDKIPLEQNADVWETLMSLCRIQGNTELGDRCAEIVEQLDPTRLNEQSKAGLIPVNDSDKKEKKNKEAQDLPEVRNKVHTHKAGDRSHPDTVEIYALLRNLKVHMKECGYVPEPKFVLHDIDLESKEEAIHAHSERLATAQALLNSPPRMPIRVIKNLRVCGDCHNAFKFISKIVGRTLIMRDAKRFHHVQDGECSCRDFW